LQTWAPTRYRPAPHIDARGLGTGDIGGELIAEHHQPCDTELAMGDLKHH